MTEQKHKFVILFNLGSRSCNAGSENLTTKTFLADTNIGCHYKQYWWLVEKDFTRHCVDHYDYYQCCTRNRHGDYLIRTMHKPKHH